MVQKKDKQLTAYLQYLPYAFLAIYLGIIIFVLRRIPSPEELIDVLKGLYSRFGYSLVFVSALAESIFLLGFYVPGSTAILLGAALARTGIIQLPVVLILGTLGLVCGYTINYFLGKHGWYHVLAQFGFDKGIETAKNKLMKHQSKALLLGYLSPSTGAFISTASGVTNMRFWKFFLLTLIGQSFWSLLWGGIAYLFGMFFVDAFLKYFAFIVWGIIGIWVLRNYVFAKKK